MAKKNKLHLAIYNQPLGSFKGEFKDWDKDLQNAEEYRFLSCKCLEGKV